MSQQKYTREEVSQNNGENGKPTWFIYKNFVYDVTSYMDDHPGGSYLIEEWAGKDATKAFNQAGHSGDAENQLSKYKIGEVEKDTSKTAIKGNKNDYVTKATAEEKIKKERRRIKLLFCM